MGFKQCEFCRKPYEDMGKSVCGECLLKLDEDFIKIREYLYEHDSDGIEEVSEETGVPRKTIFYLLKEERLIVGDDNGSVNGILTCEACKRPIATGRMCGGCKKAVVKELNESVSSYSMPRRVVVQDDEEPESIKGVAKLQLK